MSEQPLRDLRIILKENLLISSTLEVHISEGSTFSTWRHCSLGSQVNMWLSEHELGMQHCQGVMQALNGSSPSWAEGGQAPPMCNLWPHSGLPGSSTLIQGPTLLGKVVSIAGWGLVLWPLLFCPLHHELISWFTSQDIINSFFSTLPWVSLSHFHVGRIWVLTGLEGREEEGVQDDSGCRFR